MLKVGSVAPFKSHPRHQILGVGEGMIIRFKVSINIIIIILMALPKDMNKSDYLLTLAFYSDAVNKAVANASLTNTTLPKEILDLEGMSSWGIRILLNSLCANMPKSNYLEIGSWRGSTFISALYNNLNVHGTSIDSHEEFVNHSEFKTTAEMLEKNCKQHLTHGENYQLITADCFALNIPENVKYNIYLYDGYHDYLSQYKALTEYIKNMTSIFVYICDDYSVRWVEEATQQAFRDLDIQVITEHKMFGCQSLPNQMTTGFWNGYYIAVCVKRKDFPQFFKMRHDGSMWMAHRFSEPDY